MRWPWPYRVVPVDVFVGKQFEPEFLKLNPNAKVPVIVHDDGTQGHLAKVWRVWPQARDQHVTPALTEPLSGETVMWEPAPSS